MIPCPKCGYDNPDNAMNCAECRINLQFATDNIEQPKTQSEFQTDWEQTQINIEKRAKQIICTTAPWLEGYRVTKTIEVITAECVFGMNIFRDMFASVTDFFGGRSKATQKILRDARRTCLWELKKEAAEIDADAVIAINLDYNEFSGKDKSMLFLVASGTAVKIEPVST
jgi:uncharacterized protein YbjQ (UPF0145 family)